MRVAVDGVDGSGKSTFASELTVELRNLGRDVVPVSADGFHHVRAVRHRRGRDSAEGFWLDSYNYEALAENVLDPFGPNGTRRYRDAIHDVETDQILDRPWLVAPAETVLVVDGLFLHRDELVTVWDFSVFLDVPFEVSVARMARARRQPSRSGRPEPGPVRRRPAPLLRASAGRGSGPPWWSTTPTWRDRRSVDPGRGGLPRS